MSSQATLARIAEALEAGAGRLEASPPPGERDTREAAVALILHPIDRPSPESSGLEALFIRRARVPGDPWSGHVALPGGRRDPDDADLEDTVRRETCEETSLALSPEHLLGRLSTVYPASSRLPSVVITPFVARWEGDRLVRPNHEVDDWIWVPLAELRDPARRTYRVLDREGDRLEFPAIHYRGHTIWGLTHRIVREFLDLYEEARGPAADR